MSTNKSHNKIIDKNTLYNVFYHDDNIVIELDTNKKINYINAAAASYLGSSIEHLMHQELLAYCIKKNLSYPSFLTDDIAKDELFEDVGTKDAQKLTAQYISWRMIPLFSSERISGAFLFGKDKTQTAINEQTLKNVETRLNLFINSIPGYHWWKDREGKYLGCNEAVAKLLGLNSVEDVIGKTDYQLAWSNNADILTENDKRVIEFGETVSGEELVTTTNNKPITFYVIKIPLKNEFSEIIGSIGTSIDISERKRMEDALRHAQIAAESANHAKTEFIANMSHDIRTPLSGIIGMSKVLEETIDKPEQKQYASWVNESGQQLLSLLNGILEVISADNVNDNALRQETFDLRACIEDIAQLERPTFKLKNLDLKVDVQEQIPQYIASDRKKLHRIILNLLGNAIKFTDKGHVAITVKLLESVDDFIRLRFNISDTGIGIPDNLQPQVFDRFYRVNPSYKGAHTGHGLGLHIAQSYAQQLGGAIKLKSKVNEGTTFYFDLLLKTAKADDLTIAPEDNKSTDTPRISRDKNQIKPYLLLIEDNPVAQYMVEKAASDCSCLFLSANEAEFAFKLVQKLDFDLIITDIGLAGMSGIELTECIRSWERSFNKKPTPIVGLTAHPGKAEAEKCLQSGMNRVFVKPVSLTMMQEIVDTLVMDNQDSKETDNVKPIESPSPAAAALFDLKAFPVLDVEAALPGIGSKKELIKIFELMVNENLVKESETLNSAFMADDWTAIQQISHKIKGAAVYVGTVRLQMACQYLEQYVKSGQEDWLELLYHQLRLVMQETKKQLIDYCLNNQKPISS